MPPRRNKYLKVKENRQKYSKQDHKKHRAESDQQLTEQILTYQSLQQAAKNKLKESQYCYILSLSWLEEWKSYTAYREFVKGKDPSKLFGKVRPGIINKDLQDDEEGWVDTTELPQYPYLTRIAGNKDQDIDFTVVDQDTWNYFFKIYGGLKIIRPIYHSKGVIYDIELVEIRFIVLQQPKIQEIQEADEELWKKQYDNIVEIKKVGVPSRWKIEQLTNLMSRLYDSNMVVWQFEPCLTDRDVKVSMIQTIRKKNFNFVGRAVEGQLGDVIKPQHLLLVREKAIVFNILQKKVAVGKCEGCAQRRKLDFSCRCRRVIYCSRQCLTDDKEFHRKSCKLAEQSDDDEEYQVKKVERKKIRAGLVNLGNTCYMNSALQALASVKVISQYFLRSTPENQTPIDSTNFLAKFSKFMKMLNLNETFSPWSLKTQINKTLKEFQGFEQHDSGEFLLALLNLINDLLVNHKFNCYHPIIEESFHGSSISRIQSLECQHVSANNQPFLCLPITLPQQHHQYIPSVEILSWNKVRKSKIYPNQQTNRHKFVGVQGSYLIDVDKLTLQEIRQKYQQQSLILYDLPKLSYTIQVTLWQLDNRVRTPILYPIILDVDLEKMSYEVYLQLIRMVAPDRYDKLEEYIMSYLDNPDMDEVAEISRIELIIACKRGKKCPFCLKRCSWCPLPFNMILKDMVEIAPFNLQLLFHQQILYEILGEDHQMEKIKLNDCLKWEPEMLQDDNFWFCTQCQQPRLAVKTMEIEKWPRILMIMLKRFKMHEGYRVKDEREVQFEDILHIQDVKYRLLAVVFHSGSINGGHYWCCTREELQFVEYNDDRVREAKMDFAAAYLILYERQF